jgi:deazaflavin-dependent oxidoreductase (nitroreductase family)
MTASPHTRYLAPGRFTRTVMNPLVAGLTRRGVSLWGSRVLRVRGRTSGRWREVPVNLLEHDGQRYLVSPRGHTQWVRNLRVSGNGELRIGRRTEMFTAMELPDVEKPALLRDYLRRWAFEVGAFFDGVDAKATDAELRAIAPRHPIFRIHPAG